jgi:hypothetical protein
MRLQGLVLTRWLGNAPRGRGTGRFLQRPGLCGVDSEVHSPLVQGGDVSGRDKQAPETVLTTIPWKLSWACAATINRSEQLRVDRIDRDAGPGDSARSARLLLCPGAKQRAGSAACVAVLVDR